MKIAKPCLIWLAAIAAVASLAATPSMGQRAGLQIAIAPVAHVPMVNAPIAFPAFPQPMVMPFGGIQAFPAATFGFPANGFPATQTPLVVTRARSFGHAGFPRHARQHAQAGQILISQPAFPPNQVFPQNQVLVPTQVIQPGMIITEAPRSHFGVPPQTRAHPRAGASRAEVIRQLGTPSVTVITSNGETLYFHGGATVVIQNGQVAGPR